MPSFFLAKGRIMSACFDGRVKRKAICVDSDAGLRSQLVEEVARHVDRCVASKFRYVGCLRNVAA
jgi:hypothetical protein